MADPEDTRTDEEVLDDLIRRDEQSRKDGAR